MPMAFSPSMTYCTDRPARMIAVILENTMVIFSFSQPSATTVRHRMMPVATITANNTTNINIIIVVIIIAIAIVILVILITSFVLYSLLHRKTRYLEFAEHMHMQSRAGC